LYESIRNLAKVPVKRVKYPLNFGMILFRLGCCSHTYIERFFEVDHS